MKYIYKNITNQTQNLILSAKDQNSVSIKSFQPGATLTLDYPGLTLYVPNILNCTQIGTPETVPSPASVPAAQASIKPFMESIEKPNFSSEPVVVNEVKQEVKQEVNQEEQKAKSLVEKVEDKTKELLAEIKTEAVAIETKVEEKAEEVVSEVKIEAVAIETKVEEKAEEVVDKVKSKSKKSDKEN